MGSETTAWTGPTAAPTQPSTTPRSTPGRPNMRKNGGEDDPAAGDNMTKDGGQFNLRTSLSKRMNMVKKEREKEGNGARKTPGIKEIIGRYGGGDGKGPSDRRGTVEIESEGKEDEINLGISGN